MAPEQVHARVDGVGMSWRLSGRRGRAGRPGVVNELGVDPRSTWPAVFLVLVLLLAERIEGALRRRGGQHR